MKKPTRKPCPKCRKRYCICKTVTYAKRLTPADKCRMFAATGRQYELYRIYNNVVSKVFNRGLGALCLYRFGTGNRITYNEGFERSSDRRRIEELFPGAEMIPCSIGYPDWYFRSLPDPDSITLKGN